MRGISVFLCIFFVAYGGLAQQMSDAERWLKQGIAHYENGEYPKSIDALQHSVTTSQEAHNEAILQKAWNNLGNVYSQTGHSEQALQYYFKALSLAKKQNDRVLAAKVYKNIGAVYSEQKDFKSALAYYHTALQQLGRPGDPAVRADCLNNIGVVYEQQQHYPAARKAYSEALSIYETQHDEPRLSMALNNLAIVSKYLGQYDEAVRNYRRALALAQKSNDHFMEAATLNNLGNVYLLQGEFRKALASCELSHQKALAIKAPEIVVESLDGMAMAYEKLGQTARALDFRKQYEAARADFINSERAAQMAEMQVKYATLEKEAKIRALGQQAKIDALRIQRRNRLILGFILVTIAVLISSYFWRRNQKLKAILARNEAVRQTEEQERLRLARDIHDDLGSGLSKINFLSQMIVQRAAKEPEVVHNAQVVQQTASWLIGNMRDLIWALNPENTTLQNLLARIREYSSDFLEDYPIETVYDFPDAFADKPINKEVHREIFMVVKETLNNIVKHSGANTVRFAVSFESDFFVLTVTDNGHGFDALAQTQGNGLRNMQKRLDNLQGRIHIESEFSKGTTVQLQVALQQLVRP